MYKKKMNSVTNQQEIIGPVTVNQSPDSQPLTNSNGTKYWIIPSVSFPGPGGELQKCSASIWDTNYKKVLEKGGFQLGEKYGATFRTYNNKLYIQVSPFQAGEGLLDASALDGILESIDSGESLSTRPTMPVEPIEEVVREVEAEIEELEPEDDLPF